MAERKGTWFGGQRHGRNIDVARTSRGKWRSVVQEREIENERFSALSYAKIFRLNPTTIVTPRQTSTNRSDAVLDLDLRAGGFSQFHSLEFARSLPIFVQVRAAFSRHSPTAPPHPRNSESSPPRLPALSSPSLCVKIVQALAQVPALLPISKTKLSSQRSFILLPKAVGSPSLPRTHC